MVSLKALLVDLLRAGLDIFKKERRDKKKKDIILDNDAQFRARDWLRRSKDNS